MEKECGHIGMRRRQQLLGSHPLEFPNSCLGTARVSEGRRVLGEGIPGVGLEF